jgi:DNA polymerase-3 subunit delta'
MMYSFEEVIGQNKVKEKLLHSVREGRVPHALLFNGGEGHGALTLALAMSRYVLCENKGEIDACGTCKSCKSIQTLQHPDLHFSFPYFNKSSGSEHTVSDDFGEDWRELLLKTTYFNTEYWISQIAKENKTLLFSVHEANNIAKKLSLKAFYGGYKVMIIWMAELIKEDTANKLLKLLEEPPANTIFILVTESMEAMLPTVLSRVQSVQVPKIEDDAILNYLLHIGIESDRAQRSAAFANGNLWKAILFAQNENFNQGLDDAFQNWMRMCYKKDLFQLTEMGTTFHSWGREIQRQFFDYGLEQIRQNLLKNYMGEDILQMTDSERAFAEKFSKFINHFNAEDLMNELTDAAYHIGRNLNAKLLFAHLSIKVHHLLRRNQYAD